MSTLNVSNITDGTDTVGTSYVVNGSAKAYGVNGSSSINMSFNLSSFTDQGTGRYDMALTSSLAHTGLGISTRPPVTASGQYASNTGYIISVDYSATTMSVIGLACETNSGGSIDLSYVAFSAHGDLA
jgi:hypothetical protein